MTQQALFADLHSVALVSFSCCTCSRGPCTAIMSLCDPSGDMDDSMLLHGLWGLLTSTPGIQSVLNHKLQGSPWFVEGCWSFYGRDVFSIRRVP